MQIVIVDAVASLNCHHPLAIISTVLVQENVVVLLLFSFGSYLNRRARLGVRIQVRHFQPASLPGRVKGTEPSAITFHALTKSWLGTTVGREAATKRRAASDSYREPFGTRPTTS
jgi:hypothetical protein